MKSTLWRVAAFCLASLWGASSHAMLIGTTVSQCADTAYAGTVTADSSFCNGSTAQLTPSTATIVDPGVEFSLTNSGIRSIDFFDTGFFVSYSNVGSFSPDLFVFDLANDIIINSLTLVSADPLNITSTFLNNSFGILVSSPLSDGVVEFAINVSAVPEPSTLALLGLGLIGFGFARRKVRV